MQRYPWPTGRGSFFIFAAVWILPRSQGGSWLEQWHWILLGLACYFIALLFVRLRLAARAFEPQEDDTLMESLVKRCDALTHQIRILGRIFRWYVLPIAVPLGIVVWRAFDPGQQVKSAIVYLLAFAVVVWLNRWYAKRKLQPQLDSVSRLIAEVR